MCLRVHIAKTWNYLLEGPQVQTLYKKVRYKVTNVNKKLKISLTSWHQRHHTWVPGVNKADKTSYNIKEVINKQYRDIHHGIHVFLEKPYINEDSGTSVQIKVQCNRKHLLGLNGSEAAFSQVEFTQEAYDEVIAEIKAQRRKYR
jgi:hypothetical protein